MVTRRLALGLAALLACAGAVLGGEQLWLAGKARLADHLIGDAFERYRRDGEPHRPWRWADTWPVARIDVPHLGLRRHVLEGATGATLAFGPGRLQGTAALDGPGLAVVAGHRDGAFAFLEALDVDDVLVVTTPAGRRTWRVSTREVRAHDDAAVLTPQLEDRLRLVTCWPIDGWAPTPWRWVVTLIPEGPLDAGGRDAAPFRVRSARDRPPTDDRATTGEIGGEEEDDPQEEDGQEVG